MRLLRERRIDILVLAIYVALSLGMTWPLLPRMATYVAGRHMDTRVFQWNEWWVRTALLRGQNPYYTDMIYYPNGVSLAGHNVNWVSSLLSVPLSLLLGPAVAYNLTFLLTLWLSAFAMYLLAYHLTGRRDAAFLAGLIFGFAPYHLSGNWSGQMNLANVQWLPLAALYVLRTWERRRIGDALLAGLFGAFASLDCWFFMIFMGMWGVLFLVCTLALERRRWQVRTVGLYGLAGLAFAVLVGPFLWPVLAEPGEGTVSGALAYYEDAKSSDLLAFVTPGSDHPLLGPAVQETYARFSHWRPAFAGYAVLLLAGYGAVAGRRRAVLWWVSALAFAALALGTVLHIGGTAYPAIPTPYRLLTDLLPVFKLVRQANRFNVMLSMALAALAAFGGADLFARLERWTRNRAFPKNLVSCVAVGLLSAWLFFEYLAVPCPLLPAFVSPFYQQVAREEGDFALLELPLQFLYARRSTYAQTFHEKRLVNGYVARAVPEDSGFVSSSPLLKALDLRMAPDPALIDIPAEMARLAANGVRYVVIHKAPMPPHPAVEPDVLASWRALFGPAPVYEDEELIAYRLPDPAPADGRPTFQVAAALAGEMAARRVELIGHTYLQVDVTWTALRRLEQTYACDLALIGPDGEVGRAAGWTIAPDYPTAAWPAGVIVADRYRLPLDASLAAGRYRLVIRVYDPADGQELGIVERELDLPGMAEPVALFLDEIPAPVDAVFGDEMWLLGYGARQEGARLALDMYWQALVPPPNDYKVFVHLVRPADGTIVAQQDLMPRGWSYPTSLWSRLEVFVDRLDLDVNGVPSGEYQLAVGVYLPDGPRLAAVDARGARAPDDRLVIETPIVIQ